MNGIQLLIGIPIVYEKIPQGALVDLDKACMEPGTLCGLLWDKPETLLREGPGTLRGILNKRISSQEQSSGKRQYKKKSILILISVAKRNG